MVAFQVLEELGLNEDDLADLDSETPFSSSATRVGSAAGPSSPAVSPSSPPDIPFSPPDIGTSSPSAGPSSPASHSSPAGPSSPPDIPFSPPTDASSPPAGSSSPSSPAGPSNWRNVSLPIATPGRHRNVPRLRAMGGDPTCVPPNFNPSMEAIWEELWDAMPQSGKTGVTVKTLLAQYKERCRAAREHPREESPPALLPVSFSQAKDWLLRQQRAQSEPLESGSVNEEAREVVADLQCSLNEQSAAVATLLDQPARPAAPVVPQPAISLGPEPVTDSMRAEER